MTSDTIEVRDAPPGFRLIDCDAEPRHWPLYEVDNTDTYFPAPCYLCITDDLTAAIDRARCKAEHRRWKSWRILGWLSRKAYAIGITVSGSASWFTCDTCTVTRQYGRPSFRGRRHYILGLSRDQWVCLSRGHKHRPVRGTRLCAICCPCPECGSTDAGHMVCEAGHA